MLNFPWFTLNLLNFYVEFCVWYRKDEKKVLEPEGLGIQLNYTQTQVPYTEEKIPPGGFFGIFHMKSSYSHEPGVGTDTTGPGEAVFTTRRGKFKGVT